MTQQEFDPYLKWLGISKKHQPPDAYRLLGIETFEADPDVITNAADQRMAHLKNFATGKHSELSQKILNEISAARVRLLNPKERVKYDAELRRQLESKDAVQQASPAVAPALPRARPLPEAHSVPPALPTRRTANVDTAVELPAQRPQWHLPLAIGGGAGVLLSLVVAAVMLLPDDKPPTGLAEGPTDPAGGIATPTPTTDPVESPPSEPSEDPPSDPTEERASGGSASSGRTGRLPSGMLPRPPTDPNRKFADLMERDDDEEPPITVDPPSAAQDPRQPVRPTPPTAQPPVEPDPVPEPQTEPQSRLPEPEATAQESAEKEIREIYADQLNGATTFQQKLGLAAEFSREGRSSQNPPNSRFVLLCMASRLAAEAGDIKQSLAALDNLAATFEVDVYRRKADILDDVAEVAVRRAGTETINQQIVNTCRELSDAALRKGQIEAAGRFLKVALPSARKLGDRDVTIEIQRQSRELEKYESRLNLVKMARERLRIEPANPKANLAAGKWDCFIEGAWQRGLPLLAKGDDEQLAAMAAKDLANPTDPGEQVAVADLYWDLGEEKKDLDQRRIKDRAAYWYRKALPRLSGLARAKVEKRLGAAETGSGGTDYALRFDGIRSHAVVANFAYLARSPITIEAIVRLPAAPARPGYPTTYVPSFGTARVFSNYYSGSSSTRSGLGLGIETYYWNFFYCARSTSGYSYLESARSTVRVQPGKWTHLAAVYTIRAARLFVDGELAGSDTSSYPHCVGTLPFIIGGEPIPASPSTPARVTNFFKGDVKAIRVSNSVRYVDRFAAPNDLHSDLSTVLLFPMNEGGGTRITSTVGKNIYAQLHGAEWVKVDE